MQSIILRRSGYGNVKGLTISYILCQLFAALGIRITTAVFAVVDLVCTYMSAQDIVKRGKK